MCKVGAKAFLLQILIERTLMVFFSKACRASLEQRKNRNKKKASDHRGTVHLRIMFNADCEQMSSSSSSSCLVQRQTRSGVLCDDFLKEQVQVIEILDTITRDLATRVVKEIAHALELPQPPHLVVLYLHCNGGSVYETLRVIGALERLKRYAILATVIDTVAFSVAVPLFCMGDEGYRFASPHAQVMIHHPVLRGSVVPNHTRRSDCCRHDDNNDSSQDINSNYHHARWIHHGAKQLPYRTEGRGQDSPVIFTSHCGSHNNSSSNSNCHNGGCTSTIAQDTHHKEQTRDEQRHCHNNSNNNSNSSNSNASSYYGLSYRRHLATVQAKLIGLMLAPLQSGQNGLMKKQRFFHALCVHRHEDWFLTAKDLVDYGLANHAQVPELRHHVEYHTTLVVPPQ